MTEHLNPIGLLAAATCLWRMIVKWRRARRTPTTTLEQLTAETQSATPDDATAPEERRFAAIVYFGALIALGAAVQVAWRWPPVTEHL